MKYPGRGRSPAVQSDVRVHYSKYWEWDIPSQFAKFLIYSSQYGIIIAPCSNGACPRFTIIAAHAGVRGRFFLFSFFQVLENSVRFESGEMRRGLFAWKNTFGAYRLIAEIYTGPSNFLINVLASETAGLTLTGIRVYFPALQQNSMNRKEKERKSFYSFKGPACSSLLDRVT